MPDGTLLRDATALKNTLRQLPPPPPPDGTHHLFVASLRAGAPVGGWLGNEELERLTCTSSHEEGYRTTACNGVH